MKPKKVLLILLMLAAVSVQAQHKLIVNFENMNAHVGQWLYIRVIDAAHGREVGRSRTEVKAPTLSDTLYVILPNHDYVIDFFADHNQNGIYDPPPADHAYRLTALNAQPDAAGEVVVNFVHSAKFTDIAWPNERDIEPFLGVWQGYWHNLTYDTRDDIWVNVSYNDTTQKIDLEFATKGVFGIPDSVGFKFSTTYTGSLDTFKLELGNVQPGWSGEILQTWGRLMGQVVYTAFNAAVNFKGTMGPAQAIAVYEIPLYQANGVVVMEHAEQGTGVGDFVSSQAPKSFSLRQNYPNPFNPETTIPFSLGRSGDYVIEIFNTRGRKVRDMPLLNRAAGDYQIRWNGRSNVGQALPSGYYLATLTELSGMKSESVKMLLLK